MGSVNIYVPPQNSTSNSSSPPPPSAFATPSFRHVTRASLWYGPGKLARAVLTFVSTNIANQVNDAEITIPGGVSFHLLLDSIPYRFTDTSVFLEIIYDTDFDAGDLVTNTTDVDTSIVDQQSGAALNQQDNTEDQLQFNDTRRVRWKRQVFCDDGETIEIRSRWVKAVNETPDGGYLVRKRLYVTFHIAVGVRCSRIFWDPATDIETPADDNVTDTGSLSSTTTGTGTGTSSTSSMTGTMTSSTTTTNTMTGTSSSSNVAALVASFIMVIIALMF